eukprot:5632256-Alexandrium_andersonii.AAC.1
MHPSRPHSSSFEHLSDVCIFWDLSVQSVSVGAPDAPPWPSRPRAREDHLHGGSPGPPQGRPQAGAVR